MEYKVEFSKRKSISISLKGGAITVKAPYKTDKKQIEQLLEKHKSWIAKTLKRIEKRDLLEERLTEDRIKALKKEAKAYFGEKTEYYSRIMDLQCSKVNITSAKTRFGSCSSKGSISFSYRLMLYPEPAREYVVVHELAHLRYMNHSKAFYSLVEKYLPDYKERRKLLKQ